MKRPAGAVALQSEDGWPFMELGIVLDDLGVSNASNGIFKQNTIGCQFL